MAGTAASVAGQHVLPKFLEVVNMLGSIEKEVKDAKVELKSLEYFINDADKMAEDEEYKDKVDLIKELVMRLREAGFRMEDVIEEYMICAEKQHDDLGCAALPCEAFDYVKTLILRLQIAYKIRQVRSLVGAERDDFQRHFPSETRPINSRGNQNVTWHKLRMVPLFIEEDEVVGLDVPTHTLKNLLTEGHEERTVISVVGIPGIGKTTLAKHVFDMVHNNFECHALITVSQSYTAEELLRDILDKLCKEKIKDAPQNVSTMDRSSLIEQVRKCLRKKRYVVLFDDVWNENFWDDIDSALIDDKNKSRILITTRYEKVAYFCRKSSFVEVHRLEEPLSAEECFRLFCKRAFKYGSNGRCPAELEKISLEIVRQCHGLPPAIMAVGGLLSQRDESAPEWGLFSQNLGLELERNSELAKILSLSYNDLPYNLRSCLLYFGMYPEDCEIKSNRLIRQWVAEGFVKDQSGKTLEEVAQQHLIELIKRSLVQVSSFTIDGRVKTCRVHDSIREMILRKIKDTGYCQDINEHDQSIARATVRRLKITTCSHDLITSIERSNIRSILCFRKNGVCKHFISRILAKNMPLKVLDFEGVALLSVPENLCNFIHLKYLSFRSTFLISLPKSIGKLQNLETLDVRRTMVIDIPKEICKLRKLRHLLAEKISSISMKDSLGGMASLQKIRVLEVDEDGVVTRELEKLKQLRDLRITNFSGKHSKTLFSSVNEMKLIEKLHISGHSSEAIDLSFLSSQSSLRQLFLVGNLVEFPIWIPFLQNLMKLSLNSSMLTKDPLESLKDMPNLLFLSFTVNAYQGETLHFQNGGFQKLKELELYLLPHLNSIIIDREALHSLKKLHLMNIPQLKTVPSGIQHLENLEVLSIWCMPTEFEKSIAPYGAQNHWMIKHVSHVRYNVPPNSLDWKLSDYMKNSRLHV